MQGREAESKWWWTGAEEEKGKLGGEVVEGGEETVWEGKQTVVEGRVKEKRRKF